MRQTGKLFNWQPKDKILRDELKERRLKRERNIKIKNGRIITVQNQNIENLSWHKQRKGKLDDVL